MRIGLEVHVQLAAAEKLFSRGRASGSVDRLDWACPGVLPVLNMQAVRCALRAARLLKADISEELSFDRKHYKYHDLPLGYQITQKRLPLATHGTLKLLSHDYPISRVQLEQDTGKTIDGKVDLRRAGNALLELVTDPIFTDVKDAQHFCWGLVTLLRDGGGVTEGKLEEGQVRFDVNVSDMRALQSGRAEIKNLNSYKFIETAIHRLRDNIRVVTAGDNTAVKTFGFDQRTLSLFEMRPKKEYTYLPEWDVPSVNLQAELLSLAKEDPKPSRFDVLRGQPAGCLSELEMRQLCDCDIEQFHLWHHIADFSGNPKFAYNWAILEAQRWHISTDYQKLVTIISAVHNGKLSRRQAQLLFQRVPTGMPIVIPEARDIYTVIQECLNDGVCDVQSIRRIVFEQCPMDPQKAIPIITQTMGVKGGK